MIISTEELQARQITIELEARHSGDSEELTARQITIELEARHRGDIELIARQIALVSAAEI